MLKKQTNKFHIQLPKKKKLYNKQTIHTEKYDFQHAPHPRLIRRNMAPCIRMRQSHTLLILTATKTQPKPKNQTGKQPKHEVRNFKRPHPHKEKQTQNKTTKNVTSFKRTGAA